MITTYLSPKLMEELKDRAIRVAPGEDGTLIWVKAAGAWFWVAPWQQPVLERSLAGEPVSLLRPREYRHVPPPPALLEELDRIDREGEDGERLKVLGRLFERVFRRSGSFDGETLVWLNRLPYEVSAEELEAVRGIG